MDISINSVLPIDIVDTVARNALASAMSGVSVSDTTRVHLLDDSQANQDIANAILSNYDGLEITANKTTMTEGDADPIITCADASISSDAEIGYVVLLDGEVYAEGTTTVTAGEATLNLVSPVDGGYQIFMYRIIGNYASGSVTITVSEV